MNSDRTAARQTRRLDRRPFWDYATRVTALYGHQFGAWRRALTGPANGKKLRAEPMSSEGEQRWEAEGGSLYSSPRGAFPGARRKA
jgi:hypothetical protein